MNIRSFPSQSLVFEILNVNKNDIRVRLPTNDTHKGQIDLATEDLVNLYFHWIIDHFIWDLRMEIYQIKGK